MSQRVTLCSKVKPSGVAVAKASLNRSNALALGADEGRDEQRNAAESCK